MPLYFKISFEFLNIKVSEMVKLNYQQQKFSVEIENIIRA